MTDIYAQIKIERLTTATANGYRALQALLKALKDEKSITLQVKLNSSFEVLKEEAKRLIESYQPIADTQTAIATNDQKIKKILASVPSGVVSNNSEFGKNILKGTNTEKRWLMKKDGNGEGIILYKPEGSAFYLSYAGDALRLIALLDTALVVCNGILMTEIRESDLTPIMKKARTIGLIITLHRG